MNAAIIFVDGTVLSFERQARPPTASANLINTSSNDHKNHQKNENPKMQKMC